MADIADRAQGVIDATLAASLSRLSPHQGQSAHYCCECGDQIPDARRDAVHGVSLCVDCQRIYEMRRRHGL